MKRASKSKADSPVSVSPRAQRLRAQHGDRGGASMTDPEKEIQEERATELFVMLPDGGAREELVRMFFPLVEYLSRRFRSRGEPLDDLVQVASIGLLKAIDRFELDRGA